MKRSLLLLLIALFPCGFGWAQSVDEVYDRVARLQEQIKAFKANVEVRDNRQGEESLSTRSLLVSRELGWRMESSEGEVPFVVANDFKTNIEYYPKEKIARKSTADTPEIADAFRKPATDMNPLTLLEKSSLKLHGHEQLSGEDVWRIDGTTSTQLIPKGRPVVRRMELWISTKDGLPRKSVERIMNLTGSTVYSNVQINPPVSAENFQFTPPEGTKMIDAAEEARLQKK